MGVKGYLGYVGALGAVILIGWGQAVSLKEEIAASSTIVVEYRKVSAELQSNVKALLLRTQQMQKDASAVSAWVLHLPKTWATLESRAK